MKFFVARPAFRRERAPRITPTCLRSAISGLAAGCLLVASAFATLASVGGGGGEVRALLVATGTSTVLVAGTSGGGIYARTLPGTTWSRAAGTVPRYVRSIAGRNCGLLAASSTGVYRSTDCGLSWAQLTFDDTQAIAVDPSNGNNALAGVAGSGILRSVDGGTNWAATTGLGAGEVRSIFYRSATEIWAGLYASGSGGATGCLGPATLSGGVFRSVDGGQSWADVTTLNGQSIDNRFVSSVAVDGNGNAFAGTLCPNLTGKLFRAAPGGGWVVTPGTVASGGYADFGVHAIAIDPANGSKIWVGTNNYSGIVSYDSGATFVEAHNRNEQNLFAPVRAYAVQASGSPRVLRAVLGLGVFSTGGAASPQNETSVAENLSLLALRSTGLSINTNNPADIWIAGTGFGTMRSLNGAPFSQMVAGFDTILRFNNPPATQTDYRRTYDISHIVAGSGGVQYAAARDRGLFRFDVGAVSWQAVNEAGLGNANNGLVPTNTTGLSSAAAPTYWALFDKQLAQGVWRRDPNTATWALINTPNPFGGFGAGNVVQTPSGKTYALGIDFETTRSTDGFNFSVVTSPHEGFSRLYFSALAENPINVTAAVAASNKGLYRSGDSGQQWSKVAATGLASGHLSALAYSANGILFSGDRDGRILCSGDNGNTWTQRALLIAPINQIRLENGRLFYITDGAGVIEDSNVTACP